MGEPTVTKAAPRLRGLDRQAWIALGLGAVLTGLAHALPFAPFVLQSLITVVHELGHTLFRLLTWEFAEGSGP
jgi:hypothetical protein